MAPEELEQLLNDIEQAGFDVTPLRGSTLRKENGQLAKELAEIKPQFETATKELESLKRGPVRTDAFTKAGVQVDGLTKAQQHLMGSFEWEGEAPTPQAVLEFAKEWEFPIGEAPVTPTEQPNAARIVEQAGAAKSAQPLGLREQIAEAETKGDVSAAIALKVQAAREASKA